MDTCSKRDSDGLTEPTDDERLRRVFQVWAELPEGVWVGILALIDATTERQL
ncbi:MAG: hypothetical protein AAFN41_13615 [Planctomycetota bacterium]